MKHPLAALALLAASSCTMYGAPPPQGPYGTPAPYAYPAPQPYPPGSGGHPGQPHQPAPPECPITASRQWAAWINAMPGPNARPTLVVSGKVVTATGGYQVAFDRDLQLRRGQPPQAFVTLHVAPPQGGTWGTQAITHQVRWEWPLNQPIGSVIVSCGEKTLAELTNIQTAY